MGSIQVYKECRWQGGEWTTSVSAGGFFNSYFIPPGAWLRVLTSLSNHLGAGSQGHSRVRASCHTQGKDKRNHGMSSRAYRLPALNRQEKLGFLPWALCLLGAISCHSTPHSAFVLVREHNRRAPAPARFCPHSSLCLRHSCPRDTCVARSLAFFTFFSNDILLTRPSLRIKKGHCFFIG